MPALSLTKGTAESGFGSLDQWAPHRWLLELDGLGRQPVIHCPLQGQADYCRHRAAQETLGEGTEARPPPNERRHSSEEWGRHCPCPHPKSHHPLRKMKPENKDPTLTAILGRFPSVRMRQMEAQRIWEGSAAQNINIPRKVLRRKLLLCGGKKFTATQVLKNIYLNI